MHASVPGEKRRIGYLVLTLILMLLTVGMSVQTASAKLQIKPIRSINQYPKLGPQEATDSVGRALGLQNARNEIGRGKKINSYHYRFRWAGATIDVVKPNPLCIVGGDGIVYRCVYFTSVVIYGDRRLE